MKDQTQKSDLIPTHVMSTPNMILSLIHSNLRILYLLQENNKILSTKNPI